MMRKSRQKTERRTNDKEVVMLRRQANAQRWGDGRTSKIKETSCECGSISEKQTGKPMWRAGDVWGGEGEGRTASTRETGD